MRIHRPAAFLQTRSTDNGAHPGGLETRAQQRRCPIPRLGDEEIPRRWPKCRRAQLRISEFEREQDSSGVHMSTNVSKPANAPRRDGAVSGRLFFLDLAAGRVMSANPDGSDLKVIVEEGRKLPDGLAVDAAAGHLYWTNMGNLKANDGSILRSDLDGKHMTTIVAPGGAFTPKQIQIDKVNGKLYWSDREGMRVMRANLDGSQIETLVDTANGDARPGRDAMKWCVGIAVDHDCGHVYWTQKGPDNAGKGQIRRANLDLPKAESPADRSDIEVVFDGLPEPIDLDLDLDNRVIYWTDRGDAPRGNTVSRAPMDRASRNGH